MQRNSLYKQLLTRMVLFLIIPFLAVTIILYQNIITNTIDEYQANTDMVAKQLEAQITESIERSMLMSSRICDNSELKGFFLRDYSGDNYQYYSFRITSLISPEPAYSDDYEIKIFHNNYTIPRGFGTVYYMEDVQEVPLFDDFLSSNDSERWITPQMAMGHKNNAFLSFSGSYTFLEKVYIDQDLLFIISVSAKDKAFWGQSLQSLQLSQQYDGNNLYLNFSDYQLNSDDLSSQAERLRHSGYTMQSIEALNFPQKTILIWGPNARFAGVVSLIILFAVFAAVAIILVISFIRRLFRDIRGLITSLNRAAKEGRMTHIDIQSNNEISDMEHSINKLLDELNNFVGIITRQKLEVKESQLLALQQQINPHFLYNTLAGFSYKMELYGHPEEADAIVALSRMLRYNIGEECLRATIREELEQVFHYIKLQRIKYPDISFDFSIPEELLDIEMIRFIFQPIVENAVIHGYCRRPLCIRLRCFEESNKLYFEIIDDGHGIDSEKLRAINEALQSNKSDGNSLNIGMMNISRRIRLFYSDDFIVRLESEPGKYTKVKFTLAKEISEFRIDPKNKEIY